MSNTGYKKKLASFNCDEKMWTEFIRQCQSRKTTATAVLTQCIKLYLDGSLANLNGLSGHALDEQSRELLKQTIDKYLVEHLPSYLEKYLATHQDNWSELHSTVVALSEQIEDLAKSKSASSKKSPKNREFWFIKERAKYLDVNITSAQFIHVEMFANDSYVNRHGKPPEVQLYRGTQAFAYPEKDLDLLDNAIKKVVEM
jgi:hypothetical protein